MSIYDLWELKTYILRLFIITYLFPIFLVLAIQCKRQTRTRLQIESSMVICNKQIWIFKINYIYILNIKTSYTIVKEQSVVTRRICDIFIPTLILILVVVNQTSYKEISKYNRWCYYSITICIETHHSLFSSHIHVWNVGLIRSNKFSSVIQSVRILEYQIRPKRVGHFDHTSTWILSKWVSGLNPLNYRTPRAAYR